MTGLLLLVAMLLASVVALYALGVRGGLLKLAAAGLFLGATGYALQGRPGLAGTSAAEAQGADLIPLTPLRRAFYGEFSRTSHWAIIADSYTRRGKTADAVGVLKNAVETYPGDPSLWVALGNALVDHAGMLTPASDLAFRRAAELSPGHPAPLFFLGLALARSGDRESALQLWHRLLAEAPADASWRPLVEDAVAALQPRR